MLNILRNIILTFLNPETYIYGSCGYNTLRELKGGYPCQKSYRSSARKRGRLCGISKQTWKPKEYCRCWKTKEFFGLTIQKSLHKASEKNVLDVQMS
jgi:hypothetical protein